MAYCGSQYFWKTSPSLFILRIGCVTVLLSIVEWFSQMTWIPAMPAQALSRHSLLVYISHLCILYGSAWNIGLRQWLGPTQDPLHTLLWICALLGGVTALAWSRHRSKPGRTIAMAPASEMSVRICKVS
jgi:hypothetical protein